MPTRTPSHVLFSHHHGAGKSTSLDALPLVAAAAAGAHCSLQVPNDFPTSASSIRPKESGEGAPRREPQEERGRDVHVDGVDGVSQASSHSDTDSLADKGAELRARPAGRVEQRRGQVA